MPFIGPFTDVPSLAISPDNQMFAVFTRDSMAAKL